MDAPALYNAFEILLWSALGLAVGCRGRGGPPPVRRLSRVAAVAFLLFAASDAMELRTGAWWRPWWLFAWKAACVVVLSGCLAAHLRARRSGSVSRGDDAALNAATRGRTAPGRPP